MTYPEAIALRLRSLNRQPVDPQLLEEAIRIIQATRFKPGETPPSEGRKPRGPNVPREAVPVVRPEFPIQPKFSYVEEGDYIASTATGKIAVRVMVPVAKPAAALVYDHRTGQATLTTVQAMEMPE